MGQSNLNLDTSTDYPHGQSPLMKLSESWIYIELRNRASQNPPHGSYAS